MYDVYIISYIHHKNNSYFVEFDKLKYVERKVIANKI